ncbi:fructosamine kinase family protein [Seongchinamella sediminis]|uniref:Fructosamine kinase family protein n=1 Tax=Seongchinamella sediminis TaxID=2283635 RepID=A0A3L7E1B2_9GAMM|nr:fructosamine kinase family protein [Seongchinamella sediminis]RLQ23326.1 fructosamine kinase family protein [Seongchinamella sediminis]
MDWQEVEKDLSGALGEPFRVVAARPVGGGCINTAFLLQGSSVSLFLKRNRRELQPMFEAEAAGLEEIRRSATLRAPRPIATGTDARGSWLALEPVEFGPPSPATAARLGEQLAAMHRCTATAFGWQRDNYIGATEQANPWTESWVDFFARQRLGAQLELAARNGADGRLLAGGERLVARLPVFFRAYSPAPSLLHGDLWGGNWASDPQGEPVIYDPAVYFGDRETDLAMTELFGGFDDRFYQSYRDCWDIDPGYTSRKVLYQLYHVLNHFNLFGGGYASQARDMIARLNAEAG